MELDITEFFNEARPEDYSASVAEIGEHAGQITWEAAIADYKRYKLLPGPAAREAFKKYLRGFGAWSAAEIEEFAPVELNALLIQLISEDILGTGLDSEITWKEYEASDNAGQLFLGTDGRVYYDLSE